MKMFEVNFNVFINLDHVISIEYGTKADSNGHDLLSVKTIDSKTTYFLLNDDEHWNDFVRRLNIVQKRFLKES